MKQLSKRAFNRKDAHDAITFAYGVDGAYHPGKMTNKGEGGMHFETDADISPGADILIRVGSGLEKKPGAVVDNVFRGRVVWRRKGADDAASTCQVGVKYLENVCHNCGEKIHYLEIKTREDHTVLCRDCYAFFTRMDEGKLKECLESRLLGNFL